MKRLIYILFLLTFLAGCTVVRISRKYDKDGIVSEQGYAYGLYSEQAGKFSMSRKDQKGPSDVIEETAGMETKWTTEAGKEVTLQMLQMVYELGKAAGFQSIPK